MNAPPDCIEIRKLRVTAHVGVPDDELASAQMLEITVVMVPQFSFEELADDIARTVDYHRVALEIQAIAGSKPRRLIETLVSDVAQTLLETHPLRRVEVLVEKFILPDTECVAVRVVRERKAGDLAASSLQLPEDV